MSSIITYSKIIQIELDLNYNDIHYKLVDLELNQYCGFIKNVQLDNCIFQINDNKLICDFNTKEAKEVMIEEEYESLTIE